MHKKSPEDTFERMQARLVLGCQHASEATGARVIPVGSAFATAREHKNLKRFPLQLWQHDGRHASRNGIYLAAAVVYTVIFPDAEHGV